ncbi:hypothetical protein J2Z60_001806 [Lactobacillus colini]|uniref:Uncharacterized protein n=1 Tax=Lactobacillus colini TaxID=1819254 RepID=A0ABS4MG94_9LACO|nr:hypothetical protein [Lactobacillus colini]MBP2058618.1 hypothetical protein [Lactobacillus colini]
MSGFTGKMLDDLRSMLRVVDHKIDAYFERTEASKSIVIFYFGETSIITILTLYIGCNGRIYGQPTEFLGEDNVPPEITNQVDEVVSEWTKKFKI